MNARKLALIGLVSLGAAVGALLFASVPAFAYKEYFPAASFGKEVDQTKVEEFNEPGNPHGVTEAEENVCTVASGDVCQSGQGGSGKDQFNSATGVAVNDSSELTDPVAGGDVYVIDGGPQLERVERFSSTGAYLGQFDGSGSYEVGGVVKAGSPTPAGGFSGPAYFDSQGIAIDNSGNPVDPSAGAVYVMDLGHKVIDRFTAEGKYEGQLTGTCEDPEESAVEPGACPHSVSKKVIPFQGLNGVAIDPSGNLWVSENGKFDEFNNIGVFVHGFSTGLATGQGLAADSSGNLYAVAGGREKVYELQGGTEVAEFGAGVGALTINPASGELLLDKGSGIEQFAPIEEAVPAAIRAFPGLSESRGIAVNGTNGVLYASQVEAHNVELFDYIAFPSPRTGPAFGVSETGATLNATVNPEGAALTECYFEYGPEAPGYSGRAACEEPSVAEIPVDFKEHPVHAQVSGLQQGVTYHFRLVVVNANGAEAGKDRTLFTSTKPAIEQESVFSIGSVEASVSAQIDADGLPTGYRVEYGTSAAYGSSTPEVSIGAATSAASIRTRLSGLEPGTSYHFRFVASNGRGAVQGEDETFTTRASAGASASTLPDHRTYELVSSSTDDQDMSTLVGGFGSQEEAATPFRASGNGNAVAYAGYPPPEGGNGSEGKGQNNQYVATRGPSGWAANDITPPDTGSSTEYEYFSSDLSVGVLKTNVSLPAASPAGPPEGFDLYSGFGGDLGYHALFTAHQPSGSTIAVSAGASADGSHLIYEAGGAIAEEARANLHAIGAGDIYDSVGGQVHQVNVLPDGQPQPTPDASLGSPRLGGEIWPDLSNAVSADGSRIFWTSVEVSESGGPGGFSFSPKALYVRENDTQPQSPVESGRCTVASDACTVLISEGGVFSTASADGSKVFFTKGDDLFEYDLENGQTTDLTPGGEVQGIVGASRDGSYVYFVAQGALAGGATPRLCQKSSSNSEEEEERREELLGLLPAHHGCNLYVRHDGATVFIGVLLFADNNLAPVFNLGAAPRGDWRAALGERTAEVTPDGHGLAFTSTRRLTGYDNEGLREVFVYDALTGHISCGSCDPSGAPPTGRLESLSSKPGGYLPASYQDKFMEHFISDNGDRVFFDSERPLAPSDTNGREDVYEWERNGTGSCPASSPGGAQPGCIYLLSGGQSTDNSFLIDSDAEGDNVFFDSRGQLAPQAHNENVAVYDARVDGGFPAFTTECTGTGCQGVPPAPPVFATPSSVTFNGIGNFPAPVPAVKSKPKSKKQAKCKRGFVKKHNRCVKANKKKTRSRKAGHKRRAK